MNACSNGVDELAHTAEQADEFLAGLSAQATSLWAKSGDETGWLNLPQHMADAACVAESLWGRWAAPSLRKAMAELGGMPERHLRTLVIWSAGVHDIGKATVTFSRQIENRPEGEAFVNRIADAGLPLKPNMIEAQIAKFPHGLASGLILQAWLRERGVSKRCVQSLSEAADAHHGIASEVRERRNARDVIAAYPAEWKAVHNELLDGMALMTGFDDILPDLGKLPTPLVQLITGFVIMADWIASNSDAFPMVVDSSQCRRVDTGMAAIALTTPWDAGTVDASDVDGFLGKTFQWSGGVTARPVQRAVVEALSAVQGPALTIIEAPTGEGKTEAGLAGAHVIAARDGSQGIFLAAPTMATANGLFDRVVDWAGNVTPGVDVTSMYLGHSKNSLSDRFQELKSRGLEIRGVGEDLDHDDVSCGGAVVARQWLSGRKQGLLSNFVVATVDQVLMMALQTRHSMLRHLGLAGKVVIIDEVHAYDAYMSSYLRKALQWLARYQVSVILMSATLPRAQKVELANAYGTELSDGPGGLDSMAYPLVTVVSGDGVEEVEVPPRPNDLEAAIHVIGDDLRELLAELRHRTEDGGCVLVICNTIRRAQEVYAELVEEFTDEGEVELHHSAFIASSRADKEDRLREELGPTARRGAGRPHRRFVVATQVAEQSLDIDADLLVTDIAPMDLIIQRIGRLHRHQRPSNDRPNRLQEATVLVRGVVETEPVPEFDEGTAFVYDGKILLATFAVLQKQLVPRGFRRPGDVVDLVQEVYGPDPAIPEEWQEIWRRACEAHEKDRDAAAHRSSTFQIPGPKSATDLSTLFARYHDDKNNRTEEAGAAQVRDSDPTIEVIPIIGDEYGYLPLGVDSSAALSMNEAPDFAMAKVLAASTVRLPAKLSKYESVFNTVIDQLEMQTPVGWSQHYLLKGQVALVLDDEWRTELAGHEVSYSDDLGLRVE
jgi:CRISPR-associated endonuclease/helicase Cas3